MSSSAGMSGAAPVPVSALQYRDIAGQSKGNVQSEQMPGYSDEAAPLAEERLLEFKLTAKIKQERAEAARETEERLRQELEQKLTAARAPIAAAIARFTEESNDYYARIEAEVVQLSLAIAAKILHRESQVDPMLVATLVRIAIEKMREGSTVIVRVSTGKAPSWKAYFAEHSRLEHVEVVEDASLNDQDCLVETELGTANFGLDKQLKEVEQGFFDLLALRPVNR
ncbi:MAG TPA: FliH/SctL family protein [Terracidiphilus sp.]|nr:FliH/SctL family protein [Terracidiphilus sp.]